MTEFFLVRDPRVGMSVLVSRENPDVPAIPVLSPCCGARVVEPYMVTALCAGCFEVFNLEGIPVVAAAI